MSDESEDEFSSDDNVKDKDIAMVVRRFKKFMEKKRRFNRNFSKKGELNKKRDKDKGKEKDQVFVCYEYKKSEHFRPKCPLLKSSLRKKMKKALFRA